MAKAERRYGDDRRAEADRRKFKNPNYEGVDRRSGLKRRFNKTRRISS